MIHSMTGYGYGEVWEGNKCVRVEIRAVNYRFCEVYIRIPRGFVNLEENIKKIVQGKLSRGRIDVFVSIKGEEGERKVKINSSLARSYCKCFSELQKKLNLKGEIDLNFITKFPALIEIGQERKPDKTWILMEKSLNQSLDNLLKMRKKEGRTIYKGFEESLKKIEKGIKEIKKLTPYEIDRYRKHLYQSIKESLKNLKVDEARLSSEIALFSERIDINEEILRILSHLNQFKGSLKESQVVGRRLDFIVQEINREINTIGSKANSSLISQQVITVKEELEKIREQIQNVE